MSVGACGFCVHNSIRLLFENGRRFICYNCGGNDFNKITATLMEICNIKAKDNRVEEIKADVYYCCGKAYPANTQFCTECGKKLSMPSPKPKEKVPGIITECCNSKVPEYCKFCPEGGIEHVAMFTSNDEANKGPSASIVRMYPYNYLPKLIEMDIPVIINPFSESRFLLSKEIMVDILWPAVQRKNAELSEKSGMDENGTPIDSKDQNETVKKRRAFSAVSAKNNLYISSGHENASCCGLYSTTGGILIYNHWVLVIIISGIVFSVPNQQHMKGISVFVYISAVAEPHAIVCYHYLIVTR